MWSSVSVPGWRRLPWRFRRPSLRQHRLQLCAQILTAGSGDRHVIDEAADVAGELAIGIGAAVQFGGMGGISRQNIFPAALDALLPGLGLGFPLRARLSQHLPHRFRFDSRQDAALLQLPDFVAIGATMLAARLPGGGFGLDAVNQHPTGTPTRSTRKMMNSLA